MSAHAGERYSGRYSGRPCPAEIDSRDRPETVEIDRRPETVEIPAAGAKSAPLPPNPPAALTAPQVANSKSIRNHRPQARSRMPAAQPERKAIMNADTLAALRQLHPAHVAISDVAASVYLEPGDLTGLLDAYEHRPDVSVGCVLACLAVMRIHAPNAPATRELARFYNQMPDPKETDRDH